MKSNIYAAFFVMLCTLQISAAPGDTTFVRAHDGRDMVWYERYKEFAVFPTNKEYNKVIMEFTMGCATGGCSDWDYTVLVYLLHPTGQLDSSISHIDTLSTSPLIVDTIWNVQPRKERFELGRLITPYGGYMRRNQSGFNNNWTHRFRFDVTDFQIMMTDSVEFEVFYQGWQSGFKATIDFEMIEGTPARRVRSIQNIYTPGGYNYITPQQFENDVLPPKTITFDSADAMAALRFIPSGHGFINALNCAEFCQRHYRVKLDGVQRFEQLMWRDDCGLNPIYPQGGTWLYDRANWCPGSEVITYMHDLTPWYQPGSTIDFDIDIEPIVYTVPSGETPANYNLSAQIITYEQPLRVRDAAITRILSPSNHENFSRMNPSCGKAIVEITNYGSDTLREVEIHYGLHTGQHQVYHWTGSLAFNQTTIVDLPFDDPSTWTSYMGVKQFQAWTVAPNGDWDMYSSNDAQVSMFNSTPKHPGDLRLFLVTNARGDQTFWHLRNADGTVIDSGDGYANNTSYNSTTWSLPDGCYELVVGDRGKNGMSFWANNDGAGLLRLISSSQGTVRQFNPDFGTEVRYYFTVGFTLSDELFSKKPKHLFEVFPNPTNGLLYLSSNDDYSSAKVRVRDLSGRVVLEEKFSSQMDVSRLAPSQYILEIIQAGEVLDIHKISILK